MKWYYQIELEPGEFTPGKPRPTLALARVFWASVPLAGHRCLDIGTQDAVMPVLMARAGGVVTATDISSRLENVEMVRASYDVEFRYVAGMTLSETAEALDHELFDIVNFAGVLYHTLNPLGGLALARARCRVGGLMLVETAAIQRDKPRVDFNANDGFGVGAGTYFIPSTTLLEYWLRMVGLQPLAAAYQGSRRRGRRLRVAILCRSTAAACPRVTPDTFMTSERNVPILRHEGGIEWEALDVGKEPVATGDFETGIFPLRKTSLYRAIRRNRLYDPEPCRERLERDARM
jgi:hypothetical protein